MRSTKADHQQLGHSHRVLVADDVEVIRLSLSIALTSAGFDVVCCKTGREAIDILRESDAFDAAIVDLWMPETDGLAAIRAIRKERPGLRIFGMSGGGPGLSLEAATLLAEVLGAERTFIKPFDEAELIAMLQEARH